MTGIKRFFVVLADIVVASSIAPVTTTLTSPIAANQRQKLRWWVEFTVGATGGVRVLLAVPAGTTVYVQSLKLFNTVAPAQVTQAVGAPTAFTNALANAGRHWIEVELEVETGATAGNVDLTMAQNSSDALPLTILRGGTCDITVF